MTLSLKSILGSGNSQLPRPALDLTNSNPVVFVLKLNSKKDRRKQMDDLIDEAKLTAARVLPGLAFTYVPEPAVSASGGYAVDAVMYDKPGGADLAFVTLDEASGIAYVILKGDARRHVDFLRERLSERKFGKPDVFY